MSLSETQKAKKKLRNSKKWRVLRHNKNIEQKGLDPITLGKLSKTCNLHHLDLMEENYNKIDNKDNFILLNKMTHEMVHWVYKYQSKDENFIDRLMEVINKMIEINEGESAATSTPLWS